MTEPWSACPKALGTRLIPVARRLLPIALCFKISGACPRPSGSDVWSIFIDFSSIFGGLGPTFTDCFHDLGKKWKMGFVWHWPHETRVATCKKQSKIDRRTFEKGKCYCFTAQALHVLSFLAPRSFPQPSGSDLGTSGTLREDFFWPPFALCGSAREVVPSTWGGPGCSGGVSDRSRK